MNLKLIEIKRLEGTIVLKSGLHIGSGNMEMHIGGTDNPVIKHPHTLEPYIPGSSLKGKVRSLLEMQSGLIPYAAKEGGLVTRKILKAVPDDNYDLKENVIKILKIFGASAAESEENQELGPTRVYFADCYLEDAWKREAQSKRWQLTEINSENTINRITGTAEHPRFMERVPEGTRFSFSLTFKILEPEDKDLFEYLLKGLKLLEYDALGGCGSRGYGRIKFENLKLNNQPLDFDKIIPF